MCCRAGTCFPVVQGLGGRRRRGRPRDPPAGSGCWRGAGSAGCRCGSGTREMYEQQGAAVHCRTLQERPGDRSQWRLQLGRRKETWR